MRTNNDPQAIERAQALFTKKEKQRTESTLAAADYQQRQKEQLENLARLRKLRLERESISGSRVDKRLNSGRGRRA